jgi:Coenzyme PQQ synthesis protein D (PqqD)
MSAIRPMKDLALSETGFVFDPYSGATFTVNPTGLCILHGLREGLSRDEIRARMQEQFYVRGEELDRDISDFVQLLRQHELVANDFMWDRGHTATQER